MLRFVASLTDDMHVGNLRIAILNYIVSKQLNEELLIRIDDTDKTKNIEGKEKDIIELLSLFSIEHQRVVYQSENLKYHQKMAMQLMSKKKAFSCFCSDEKLNELEDEAKKNKKIFNYDGFCATLSDETVINCNAPFTVRINKPKKEISFKDSLRSECLYNPSQIDSFIILKHDKTPTYDYACGIDDMIHDISTVIKEDNNLINTPKQIYLRSEFNYNKEIHYIHIPTISNDKPSIQCLIDEGFLPSAIANYLVLLGNDTPTEVFSLEEAIQWFDITKISKIDIKFDIEKLKFINRKHLQDMELMRLSKLLGFADLDIGKLAKVYLEEVSTLKELKSKIEPIFLKKSSFKGSNDNLNKVLICLRKAPFINSFDDLEKYIIKETSLNTESLSKILRYTLTGALSGPALSDIYPLIKNYIGEIVK